MGFIAAILESPQTADRLIDQAYAEGIENRLKIPIVTSSLEIHTQKSRIQKYNRI
jgi:hypothetical protein